MGFIWPCSLIIIIWLQTAFSLDLEAYKINFKYIWDILTVSFAAQLEHYR
jgi:hypothetical protein